MSQMPSANGVKDKSDNDIGSDGELEDEQMIQEGMVNLVNEYKESSQVILKQYEILHKKYSQVVKENIMLKKQNQKLIQRTLYASENIQPNKQQNLVSLD